MPQVDTFSQLLVARDRDGGFFELLRNDLEVACPTFDSVRQCMLELHVFHSDDGIGPSPDIFTRQAKAATRISDPHVAKVYDFGEDEGACFYTSEFVDGELLEAYLDRCAPLPEAIALHLILDAARGLSACSEVLAILAGMDLLQSRVRLDCSTARFLTLKVGGYSFGSRKAETLSSAGVHEYYIRSLAEVLVWAVSGRQIGVDELTAEESKNWSEPALALLDALDGNRPSVKALDVAEAAIERTLHAILTDAESHAMDQLPEPLLPLLPLQSYLTTKEELHAYLGDTYPLTGDPLNARTPLRLSTVDADLGQKGTLQLLPTDDLFPADVIATIQGALGKGTALDQPNLIRMLAHWPSENTGFFIEEDVGQVTLEDVIEWKGAFSPEETLLVLDHLEFAGAQAKECGLQTELRGAGQIVIHFLDSEFTVSDATARELAAHPLSQWPAFRVKVRTFPTFLSLLRCPPALAAVPQRKPGKGGSGDSIEFAWWTQQMLGNNTAGEHRKLHTLAADVVSGKSGAMIHTNTEFLRTFRALVESPGTSDDEQIPPRQPEATATDATRMRALQGKRPLRSTHSRETDHSDSDQQQDPHDLQEIEESDPVTPGFAEMLFQNDGGTGETLPSPIDNYANEDDPNVDIEPLMDDLDDQPASFIWLALIVVIIALLLAAVFAQLSGNAFWLR